MKHEIPVRITVVKPLKNVTMRVQRGKDELLPPTNVSPGSISFDFMMNVDLAGKSPNFLGKYAQGPKDARFVYVNSGTYAGQEDTCWSRRAKISLMSITHEEIKAVLAKDVAFLHAEFEGGGNDGGPTCASVKGIEWKVVTG